MLVCSFEVDACVRRACILNGGFIVAVLHHLNDCIGGIACVINNSCTCKRFPLAKAHRNDAGTLTDYCDVDELRLNYIV